MLGRLAAFNLATALCSRVQPRQRTLRHRRPIYPTPEHHATSPLLRSRLFPAALCSVARRHASFHSIVALFNSVAAGITLLTTPVMPPASSTKRICNSGMLLHDFLLYLVTV
jgi:hypothetical protein